MDVTAHQTSDIDELQRRIRNTTNAKQRDRYRVILLAIRGLTETDGVCTLRGKNVQRILKEEFGVKYTLDGAYAVLHRLGFSRLRPRPKHRKNDRQKMAQWVNDAPLLSSV